MKKNGSVLTIISIIIISTVGCEKDRDFEPPVEIPDTATYNGNPQGVMIQGFYWDVPEGGTWWNNVKGKISDWDAAGITAIWLPPSNKCQSGPYSVGYDPYDYFDFGTYDQMGTIETRYGNKQELTSLINTAHTAGLKVYADIVMNHNGGGASEYNPNTDSYTYTDFTIASGLFNRSYNDFHPSTYEVADEAVFGGYPDLCHKNPNVSGWLWENSNSVAKYYSNTLGYDGWRFDFVLGYSAEYVRDFYESGGGFGVIELWDGNTDPILSYLDVTGTSAFDFPLMYTMEDAFNNSNLTRLRDGNMLSKYYPQKAVTFVANHDVDIISKKLLAYAFILTHEGYPCLFYRDYEEWMSQSKLNALIWINRHLASGSTTVLYADNDEYIARMNGNPGLIVYLNISASNVSREVQTLWQNSRIHDYANNWDINYNTDESGNVTIWAPANSYTVWSDTSAGVGYIVTGNEHEGSGGGDESLYTSMYLRGTMNGWGTSEMIESSNNLWEITVDLTGTYEFKFDAYGDWGRNWGDDNADGIANQGGANISEDFEGSTTIQFNVSTLEYTLTTN